MLSRGKHAYFRAIRAFYNRLHSPKSGYNFQSNDNPVIWAEPPKVAKLILPSLTRDGIELHIGRANLVRDKAIMILFTDSGLRLTEVANIKLVDINWQSRIIKVLAKGGKEAYAPFGELSKQNLTT